MKTIEEVLAGLTPDQQRMALERYHETIRNPPKPTETLKELIKEFGFVLDEGTEGRD